MELRQLRYFIKAAELSNFTEAAKALFISQSTLSQQIQQLENEFNTLLFDRLGKRVRLTEAGNIFLPAARKTVKNGADAKQLVQDLSDLVTGTLTIGLTYGLSDLVINSINDFSATYPTILIQMIYDTSDGLIKSLSEGKIDFMLSFIPKESNTIYESIILFESNLSLIVPCDHAFANKKRIKLSDIQLLPLALPVSTFSIRKFLDTQIAKQQLKLNIRLEANDINSLLQLAATGSWYTVLMESSIFNYPELKAVPISGKGMESTATVTWLKDVYRKKAVMIFMEVIKTQILNQGLNAS